MKVGAAIAEILRREGVTSICGYPLNYIFDYGAAIDIRPIIARTERVGGHMADAVSRVTSGQSIGVYATQHGPGIENGMGAVAQAYSESVPLLVLPMGYSRKVAQVEPNFHSLVALRPFVKSVECITSGAEVPAIMRRAFSKLRNGRGGPVVVEIPFDVWHEEVPEPLNYTPAITARFGPDPADVQRAVDLLLQAERPILYAGQGVHYARAWPQVKALAEKLALPVMTSLEGKSAFPEDHPLALGTGGLAMTQAAYEFLQRADVIFGVGCSFTESGFATPMPTDRRVIHATLDPNHLNKDLRAEVGLIGDASLTLDALLAELERRQVQQRSWSPLQEQIAAVQAEWMAQWLPKLTSDETPLTPYRVIWDMLATVDVANTIITHDAGSPRDQLAPFWKCTEPLSYIGWGKDTQLGYGLALAMGAKLAKPEKLCINVWGDAAFGFTGLDLETAVRERLPILSILFNNSCMAVELEVMALSTEKYRSTDISGDYTAMARAMGCYAERIENPEDIIPALRRGIEKTQQGVPVLLEFITGLEVDKSSFGLPQYAKPIPQGRANPAVTP